MGTQPHLSDVTTTESPTQKTTSTVSQVSQSIDRLRAGARDLTGSDIETRRECAREVLDQVVKCSRDWVDVCCTIKSIPVGSSGRGEEVLAGPGGVTRYLRLMIQTLDDIARTGKPLLPGKVSRLADGRLQVPMLPARGIYDTLMFSGIKANARMQTGVEEATLHGNRLERLQASDNSPRIGVVLGAGNVSSIPTVDSLTRIFQDGNAVLLKLNPVQDELKSIFEDALQPLIKRGWLQILTGGADVGAAAIHHDEVDEAHITGSHHTHDAIVWGRDPEEQARRKREHDPLLKKPITSEMGNVSPWIIVPGNYSEKELKSQATHLAASLANNAGFNCLTTRMIVTWKKWPDRRRFLDMVQAVLETIPPRVAYYPGAEERYERFTGEKAPIDDQGRIPWKLITDLDPEKRPQLCQDESFICVTCETVLDAETPEAFLERAVEFSNEQLFGTLSSAITMPDDFRKQNPQLVSQSIDRMRYGSVCINQWPALVYGLMTPPWGGAPESTLDNVQSGIGSVHNTYFLEGVDKTVLHGPLCNFPKPVWFPTHKTAEEIGWKLIDLYHKPSITKLPGIMLAGMRG